MSVEKVFLNNINKLLEKVLQGKIEHLPQAKVAKRLTEELIIYQNEKDLSGTAIPSRSNNNTTELYHTNNKIKKVNLVSNEDIQGLLKNLNFCIDSIKEFRTLDALWTLERLANNIKKNLEGEI